MKYSIDLDIAYDEGSFKSAVDDLVGDLYVMASVVTMDGPGGGWPLVRFSADSWEPINDLIDRYFDDDPEQAEWVKDELVEKS